MRTFAHRPKAIQQIKTAKSAKPTLPLSRQSRKVRSILQLEGAIGNQAVQRLLRPSVADQIMRMPEPQLQHGCPCGGECPKCQKERPGHEAKNVQAIDTGRIAGPPVVDRALSSAGPPVDAAAPNITGSRLGHDFSRVRARTDAEALELAQATNALRVDVLALSLLPLADGLSLAEGERLVKIQITPRESPRLVPPDVSKAIRAACDKRCGPLVGGASFGETECDVDKRGNPTGTVRVTVTDTDPCTRPCVERHEAIHAVHLAPVCRQLHACIKTAGQDYDAQDKCYETFQTRLLTTAPGTECAAYKAEAECMHGRQSQPGCASKEARARLASRLRGVECYRDCFCTGVATGSAPKRKR